MPRQMWIEPEIIDMTGASNKLDRKKTRLASGGRDRSCNGGCGRAITEAGRA